MEFLNQFLTLLWKGLHAGNMVIGYILIALPVLAGLQWLFEKKINTKSNKIILYHFKRFNKVFFYTTNIFLLIYIGFICIQQLPFIWTSEMMYSGFMRYIAFSWTIAVLAFMVSKEFFIKPIGARIMFNLCSFMAFGLTIFMARY